MKTELIYSLTEHFEAHAQQTSSGVELWLARDLQHLLGYAKWENFVKVVNKAEIACETSGHAAADHFPDVRKMVCSRMPRRFAGNLGFVHNLDEVLPLRIPKQVLKVAG